MIILVRKYETCDGYDAEEVFEFDSLERATAFKERHYSDGLGWKAYRGEQIEI